MRAMPLRNITPGSYVGLQVHRFRRRKGWSQQALVDRLRELGITTSGWDQTKVHKLETGKLKRVLVDDVFELAAALDVSPLYLMTPTQGFDDDDNALKVWIGGKLARWPRDVRQWVRGVRPLLGLGDYADDESASAGQRFYLFESQSLNEWALIRESGTQAGRVSGSLEKLLSEFHPASEEPLSRGE
jgi:transcriptional regulator with XRE-family HTH domain